MNNWTVFDSLDLTSQQQQEQEKGLLGRTDRGPTNKAAGQFCVEPFNEQVGKIKCYGERQFFAKVNFTCLLLLFFK